MPYRNYNKTPAAAATTAVNQEVVVKTEQDVNMTEATDKKEVPAWLSKIKEGGVKKVPKDVQKRRRNFRLKKMLTPKPPMMVLFELVNHSDIQFESFISDPITRLLRITATYDGKTFEGVGPTKSIAKNICSEQILQHIAFTSCMKDAENGNAKGGSHGEEETPWTALASVALFKLFNDWQAQGVTVPSELMKSKSPAVILNTQEESDDPMEGAKVEKEKKKPAKPKEPKGPKALPENPTSRHPVQLLNEMEGQLQYETTISGQPPQQMFTLSVNLKDNSYSGTATNKKDAKKKAAQAALAAIYNVHYPAE